MPQKIDIIDPGTAETLAALFAERVRRTPEAHAYRKYSPEKDRFESITWREAWRLAGRFQAALVRQGLEAGDRVAIMLRNCPEWILFDLASQGLGLVTVPLFAEDRPSNIRHILRETGARLTLAPSRGRWLEIEKPGEPFSELKQVVVLDARDSGSGNGQGANVSDLSEWLKEEDGEFIAKPCKPDALATIVYTSGTTGLPKGVMLSHANILANGFACLQRISICRDDLFLSFLPLSHTFERTVGHYIPMMAGSCVAYVRSIEKLTEDFQLVRPTILISVPRIYERVYAKIGAELKKQPALARYLFRLTVDTGWQRFLRLQGKRGWRPLFLLWPLLERVVARKVMSAFGGRLRLSISGGAPIGLPVARAFIGLGLNFLQGYGLTETSPVISVNATADNDPATVGLPLQGIETIIAADGELLVRGPNVMLGYWRNSEATEDAIDPQGYFHTGDIAEEDASGRLKIIGRIKEIIVLSTGEKIPPGDLELAIVENPLFDQVMIVGEGRPFLAALVVLDKDEWKRLADEKNLQAEGEDIMTRERVERILLEEMARMIHRFPGYAKIRRLRALTDPWTIGDGLITHSLKLRRSRIAERFKTEIEALFEGH